MTATATILDGGMGKHLERAGAPFRQPEWSALALLEDPSAVQRAHEAFIAAGADVITTNAYAVVPYHLGAERFAERGRELAALAGHLARAAADATPRGVRVAGSIPPLFGSYEPEAFDPDRAPGLWRVIIEAQAPHVDLWLAETVSSTTEASTIVAVLDDVAADGTAPSELWVSYTVPDEINPEEVRLRSGESIAAAVDAVAERADAILFNCSPPEPTGRALAAAIDALGVHAARCAVGAYANAFEPKPEVYASNAVTLARRDELTPDAYADTCAAWIAAGARIVGGCCHMHTEHIEELARRFGED